MKSGAELSVERHVIPPTLLVPPKHRVRVAGSDRGDHHPRDTIVAIKVETPRAQCELAKDRFAKDGPLSHPMTRGRSGPEREHPFRRTEIHASITKPLELLAGVGRPLYIVNLTVRVLDPTGPRVGMRIGVR